MSDHIPDLTKMIGDTPISDSTPHNVAELGMLCRRLERLASVRLSYIKLIEAQNDAANDRIKRMEDVVNDPHALWINWLRGDVKLPKGIGDVRQYQDRIKRLEDRIHQASMAFFRDGSHGQVASGMLSILEEERSQKP
jgi:hypothetical protein